MSERKAILCDKPLPGTEQFVGRGRPNVKTPGPKCPRMSVGKCVLCEDDVCAEHALYPTGGLVITVRLCGTQPQSNPPLARTINERAYSLAVCASCSSKTNVDSYLEAATRDAAEQVTTSLRAALTAAALTQIAPSEPR
jgi:hypothetical protein